MVCVYGFRVVSHDPSHALVVWPVSAVYHDECVVSRYHTCRTLHLAYRCAQCSEVANKDLDNYQRALDSYVSMQASNMAFILVQSLQPGS